MRKHQGQPKPIFWMGSSQDDLRGFPEEVRSEMGYGLYVAQKGGKHPDAKPLKGFRGASVLEIIERHDGNTYRAVYTVRLADAVYLLHAFEKKSKRGIATPKPDLDLIKRRLQQAEVHHKDWTKRGKPQEG